MTRASLRTGVAVSLLLALAACGRFAGLPNLNGEPPTPALTVEPSSGTVPLRVLVDSSASRDDGEIVKRELAVGDGRFEEVGERHSLSLFVAGNHVITLRLTDDSGRTSLAQANVSVEPDQGAGTAFRIDILYPGGRMPSSQRPVFEAAARRWGEVVVGDVSDAFVRYSQVEQACGYGYGYSGTIDDLLLFADLRNVDGPGGIVGMAGACLLRADGFPLAGVIILDSADLDQLASSGDLPTVIRHELGHVLDLSLGGWERRGLLAHERPECYDSRSVRFTGSTAAEEFARLGGGDRVPVEDNGIVGTACSHWDEETFRSELMTGYFDRDAALSRVTAAALGDMGYQVSLEAADPYALPSPSSLRARGTGLPIRERLLPVGGVLEEDGELRTLPQPAPLDLELMLNGGESLEPPHDH
jgi:hypothetical protein